MSDILLSIVVATGQNRVIGVDGDLPWRIPSDLKRFKALTTGKPIIMGRKTWDSLPRKPLPGRTNIVVSRNMAAADGAVIVHSLDEAVTTGRASASEAGVSEVCLIGGAQLYQALMDQVDRIYLTEVALSPEGDAYFPALDDGGWVLSAEETCPPEPGDDAGYTFKQYDRC